MIKYEGITVTDKLTQFLKANNAWEKFCDEVNASYVWNSNDEITLADLWSAFHWDSSINGLDYWSTLEDKFE